VGAADAAAEEKGMEGKGEVARAVGARARGRTAVEEKAVEETETVVVAMAMVGVKAVAVIVAIAEAGPAAATAVVGAASTLEGRSPDSRIQTRTQCSWLQHRRRRKYHRCGTGSRSGTRTRLQAVPSEMAAVAGKRAGGARAAEERAASAAMGVATVAGARSHREGRGPREEAGKEVLTAAVATAVVVRAAGVASREAEVWAVTAAGAVLAAVSDS